MKKIITIVIFLTFFVKLLSAFKEILFANYFGTTLIADAYNFSLTLPLLLIAFFNSSIKILYIPKYTYLLSNFGIKRANKFTVQLFFLFFIFSILIIFLYYVFGSNLILILGIRLPNGGISLIMELSNIFILSIVFIPGSSIMISFLQTKNSHIQGIFSSTFITFIPLFFLLFTVSDIYILASSFLVGTVIQYFYLFFVVVKFGLFSNFIFDFHFKDLHGFFINFFPLFITIAIKDLNILADKYFATYLPVGSISSITYSVLILSAIQVIIITPITSIYYPKLSKYKESKDHNKYIFTIGIIANTMLLILIPLTFYFILLSDEVISLLFYRGQFEQNSVTVVSSITRIYISGTIFYGFTSLMNKILYIKNKPYLTSFIATISVSFNIVLNYLLISFTNFGINGLAYSTTISIFLTFLLTLYFTRSEFRKVLNKSFIKSLFLLFISSFFAYWFTSLIFLSGNLYITVILKTIVFLTINLSILYVFKFKELVEALRVLINFIGNNNS